MSTGDAISFDIGSSSTSGAPRPVTLFVALDSSKPMDEAHPSAPTLLLVKRKTMYEFAVKGASTLLDSLSERDDAFVVSFNKEAEVLTDGVTSTSSDNKEKIKTKLHEVKPDGDSAKFYDIVVASTKGVLAAAAKQQDEHGRSNSHERWVVIVTGGEDTTSASSLSSTVQLIESIKRQLGTDVFHLAILGISLGERAKSNVQQIKKAGGQMIEFIDVQTMNDLTEAFDQLSEKVLKSRTAVSKPPSNEKDDENEDEEEEEWEGDIQKGSHVRVVDCSRGSVQSVSVGDIGVVQKRDSDGDYVVNFPRKDGFFGRPSDFVLDEMAERVRPGAIVRVKPSIREPVCGWGSVSREMHGMVTEVKHDGAVKVQFGLTPDSKPSEGLWTSQLKELEVVDPGDFRGSCAGNWPGKLQLGMAVRVPARVSSPSTGWGNLKPGEVGYVRAFKFGTKSYVCDFPSTDGWQGREADLEMERVATLIRPGKEVRVRKGVEPDLGWGGVTPESVGRVLSCSYDGRFVTVKFPEHKEWKGRLSELETIDRPPTERATAANGAINCPSYHGLTELVVPDEGSKTCDFCGKAIGPGFITYTCSQCDVDACQECYESQPPEAVASPTPSVASSNEVPFATAVSPDTTTDVSGVTVTPTTVSSCPTSTAPMRPDGSGADKDKLILIKGLTSEAGKPYNDKLGEIMSSDEETGLHTIKMVSEEKEKVFKLRSDKFEPAEGRLVALCDMEDPKLDGKIGEIVGYSIATGMVRINIKKRFMSLPVPNVNVLPEPDELT